MSVHVCIFRENSLPDKIVAGSHEVFSSSRLYGCAMTPTMKDLEDVVRGKNIAVVGGGFEHLFEEICRIATDVTFILRNDDVQPDEDSIICRVESWFNYWCQLPNHSLPLFTSIYQYTFRYPSVDERILYQGIQVTGALTKPAREFCKWLKDAHSPEHTEQLVRNGKKIINGIQSVIDTRIQSAVTRDIFMVENNSKIKLALCFGDSPIRESLCQLLESFECDAAIMFSGELKTKTMRVYCASQKGTPTAMEITRIFTPKSDGSRYMATGHVDWKDLINNDNFIELLGLI